jgi:hypothetical protein
VSFGQPAWSSLMQGIPLHKAKLHQKTTGYNMQGGNMLVETCWQLQDMKWRQQVNWQSHCRGRLIAHCCWSRMGGVGPTLGKDSTWQAIGMAAPLPQVLLYLSR